MVVDTGIEHEGLAEHEIDAEEALQPVGLAHHEAQAEVVVRVVAYGRQSRQGGESGAYEADDALWQGGVVEFSPDGCIGKITLHRDEVDVVVIARGDDEVVEAVGTVVGSGGETGVADADGALGVVQAAGGEVGMDVGGDDAFFEFVGEMEGGRCEACDDTIYYHVVPGVPGLCDEVAELSHEVEFDVGIVDADSTGDGVVGEVAVDMDVLVGIALVVEVGDESFGLDVL